MSDLFIYLFIYFILFYLLYFIYLFSYIIYLFIYLFIYFILAVSKILRISLHHLIIHYDFWDQRCQILKKVSGYFLLSQITDIFESLPNGFAADLADDFVYSGRLQSFGDLSSRDKTVTIATSWSNADRLMFYFELLDIKGTRGNCSDSYLQIFDKGRAEKATLEGLKRATTWHTLFYVQIQTNSLSLLSSSRAVLGFI